MVLPDVNVLVYAHREDAATHKGYRDCLERLVNGDAAYGMSDLVLSGFIRVVTHPKVFKHPTKVSDALAFAGQLVFDARRRFGIAAPLDDPFVLERA